jgi:sialate O-acetylesterase
VPGDWESQWEDARDYNGVVWLRRHFTLPADRLQAHKVLTIGAVDDEDWTYLNGQLIGHIGQDTDPTDYWSALRQYPIPAGLLKAGDNVLAVRVNDLRQAGGIVKGPVGIFLPGRWLASYYVNEPVTLDDPYRYERW